MRRIKKYDISQFFNIITLCPTSLVFTVRMDNRKLLCSLHFNNHHNHITWPWTQWDCTEKFLHEPELTYSISNNNNNISLMWYSVTTTDIDFSLLLVVDVTYNRIKQELF
ncbi:uncharacterized protein TM35_001691000, partial [Trypanosoma theileri]